MSFANYNNFVSASEIAKMLKSTYQGGLQPNLAAIHQLLTKYGLKSTQFKYVRKYNRNNAMSCIMKHIDELKELSDKLNAEAQQPKQEPVVHVPRKKGETNAHRELDKLTLYNEERLDILIKEAIRSVCSRGML